MSEVTPPPLLRVLLLDGQPADAALTRDALMREPDLRVEYVATLAEAEARLAQSDPDVLLTELRLADGSVHGPILALRRRMAATAIVVRSDVGDAQDVLALLRLGADDYLRKRGTDLAALPAALRQAYARRLQGSRRHDRLLDVLYVEGDAMDADLTQRHLARHAMHLRLHHVNRADDALNRLPSGPGQPCAYDVVLTDYQLPGDNGLELLHTVRETRRLDIPVVLLTGQGSHAVAAQALRDGATDYLTKDDNHLALLPLTLENAFHRAASAREHARLLASEQRLALILQGSNDGAWDIDLRTRQAYASARWWAMIGHKPQPQLQMAQMVDALIPEERESMAAWLDTMLQETRDERFEVECHLSHADGRPVPIVARGVVLRNGQGEPMRMAGTNTDLTAWRRVERDMRELAASLEQRVQTHTQELAQANKELEAYAESISSDLRAPLHAIDGLAQVLSREHGPALGGPGLHLLTLMRGSVYRAEGLIRDLLSFARSAREPLTRGHVPMGAVVRHCISEQATAIAELGITVQIDPMPNARGDVGLLRQVMAQLIGNAIKFSAGRTDPHIQIGHDGEAWFVRDSGVGFDMAAAEGRLFKLFSRLHSGNYAGNGVGLAIAARLIERHGGTLVARSAPELGSTFAFTLGG